MNRESYEERLSSQPFFTVKEFAKLCGRSVRWAYDRVYSGDLNVMETGGTTTISSAEVRRFLSKDAPYRGKRSTPVSRSVKTARSRPREVAREAEPVISQIKL
jgi:hypothetical protein